MVAGMMAMLPATKSWLLYQFNFSAAISEVKCERTHLGICSDPITAVGQDSHSVF